MKSIGVAGIALASLVLCAIAPVSATGAVTPADCSVPVDRLLRRLELDLPGDTRVTARVDIPADTEILIEAFEKNINSRLEVRAPGAAVATAENALHRWPPHRLIIAKGSARTVDVTVAGLERAHGRVDVRISRVTSHFDRRCIDFWRVMASGDAAYSRGAMIFRAEIDAAPGASRRAYESAIAAYARAAQVLGPGGFDEAQTRLVYASALMNAMERYQESLEAAFVAEARFKALGHDYGRDLARFHWAWSMTYSAMRTADAAEAKRRFETAGNTFRELAASHLRRGERFDQAQALDGVACIGGHRFRYADAIAGYQGALEIFDQL